MNAMKSCTECLVSFAIALLVVSCNESNSKVRTTDGRGGTQGAMTSLRGYDCITLKPVEIEQELGLPGLPTKLGPAIAHELNSSELWVYSGPISPYWAGLPNQPSLSPAAPQAQGEAAQKPAPTDCRSVALRVRIVNAAMQSGKRPGSFSSPKEITCEIEVRDSQTDAVLVTDTIKGRSGPTAGQRMLATAFVGHGGIVAPNEDYERQLLFTDVAQRINKVLTKAKTGRK